jgi:hypothetical protein
MNFLCILVKAGSVVIPFRSSIYINKHNEKQMSEINRS